MILWWNTFNIVVLFLSTFIRMFIKKMTKTASCRSIYLLFTMMICLADLGVTFSGYLDYPVVLDILKVFIAMIYVRTLREGWRRIFGVLYQSMALLFLILTYVLFSSLIAFIIYHGMVVDNKFLPDLQTTVF